MATLKAMIFDVNETLLDLAPLRTSVGKALKGREDLLTLWFSTMLHYSLVETLTNNYHDFGQIGAAALMMVAESHGIALEPEIASQSIVEVITKLPAHDSVEDVAAFKPDPRTYLWALKKLGLAPEEVMMIAAHAWDLAGAKAVGLQTAFIQRPGAVLYPHTSRPDYVVENLTQLVKQISSN